jgi:hypothetical protein
MWNSALLLGALSSNVPLVRPPSLLNFLQRKSVPLFEETPESITNVANRGGGYEIAMPTPEAAVLDGMYCRGGACQYRTAPPLPTVWPTPIVPAVFNRNQNEFCHGIACLPGMGMPADTGSAGFKFNCAHLYIDVGGGLVGKDGARTIADAKASFFKWCTPRFPPPVHTICNGLGDVLVMALRGSANAADVGDVNAICYAQYLFIGASRQAWIDLRLLRETLPKVPAMVQEAMTRKKRFLPSNLAQGGGDLGPLSPRGLAWREFALSSRRYAGTAINPKVSMLQYGPEHENPYPHAPQWPGPSLDPPFTPDYVQAPPCQLDTGSPKITKVTLNNAIPPAEIEQDLLEFCKGTFAEIMLGFGQTAEMVVTMVNDWCSWQSSVTDWVGRHEELGHPEWDFRRCEGMQAFVSYALRGDLDTGAGLGPGDVCRRLYLSMGDVEWMSDAIDNAWAGPALRGPPSVALSTAGDTDAMKKLMEDVAKYTEDLFSKLRDQKDMYDNLNGAKMDTSTFSLHVAKNASHGRLRKKIKPRPNPLPPLPAFDELR